MSTGTSQPFRPSGTVALTATTTSASIALVGGGQNLLVTNATTSIAFVRFGADPTVSAGPIDMPVLPNTRVLLDANPLIGYAAALLLSGSGSVYFTRGDGSYL